MKATKLIITLTLILQTIILTAQEYKFISQDLHLMNEKEMADNQVQITGNIKMYDVDGNQISPDQINDIMLSGNFMPEVYGNMQHEAVAIVFRATNAEEKKFMRDAMKYQDPNANFVSGKTAKQFNAYDINGTPISLSDYLGKIVVLNFWYTDCPMCINDFPKLNTLKEKYSDVVFINITFDKKSIVQEKLTANKLDFIQITDNETILQDYEILAYPTNIVIDQSGKIVFRKIGSFLEKMDRRIELLLK